ncbi:hypothetical protein BIZ37_19910 [Photobacterium sp. BZF1]|uniref:hypothetical protein n=1 Tax=Photobacterium sp. BZF1 TaxID=1904457 RepID=UPI0016539062|nr:hypothetical protein [Photobacterium sp. BZF1]MBC7004833.1 hypothetical protein [Photobacterium sp. BZF1]
MMKNSTMYDANLLTLAKKLFSTYWANIQFSTFNDQFITWDMLTQDAKSAWIEVARETQTFDRHQTQ